MPNINSDGVLLESPRRQPLKVSNKTIMVDHASRETWLRDINRVYEQVLAYPKDSGLLNQYNAEKQAFESSYPPPVEGSEEDAQMNNSGFSDQLLEAGSLLELKNLREATAAATGEDRIALQAALTEQTRIHAEAFPQKTPAHISHVPNEAVPANANDMSKPSMPEIIS
ncbi:hypothetical protein EZV61_03465 [Corallincola luteus]|uniref:Uncharacterized protein n=1 Tax=Corallincola luteus TaxID=1775177 RepID=A0ABY2APD3_9GAMM|nr:hypothetical protein [Corallincola luteus]TCI05035.1 hypothetical protein EZV61_03465 [Corallincola luteus]